MPPKTTASDDAPQTDRVTQLLEENNDLLRQNGQLQAEVNDLKIRLDTAHRRLESFGVNRKPTPVLDE